MKRQRYITEASVHSKNSCFAELKWHNVPNCAEVNDGIKNL